MRAAQQRAPRDGRAHLAGPTYAPNEYFLSVENKIENIFDSIAVNKNLCFPEKICVFLNVDFDLTFYIL